MRLRTNYPLPREGDACSFQYAHGFIPASRWARKRRFRKGLSNRTIEAVELQVAWLLREDAEAAEPPVFEIMNYAQLYMRGEQEGAEKEALEQEQEQEQERGAQGEGEQDEFFDVPFAAEMVAALAAHAMSPSLGVGQGGAGE